MSAVLQNHVNVNGRELNLNITRENVEKSCYIEITLSFTKEKHIYKSNNGIAIGFLVNIFAYYYIQITILNMFFTVFLMAAISIICISNKVTSEKLLVIPNTGIQYTTTFLFSKKQVFIDWNSIKDIVINEVIQMQRVLYYLKLIEYSRDELKVVPLFRYTKPRLATLAIVYTELQNALTL